MGPIEERLSERLDTIVRSCKESATQSSCQSAQSSSDHINCLPAANMEVPQPSGNQSMSQSLLGHATDDFASYMIPPEPPMFETWPELGQQSLGSATSTSGPANHSAFSQVDQALSTDGHWIDHSNGYSIGHSGTNHDMYYLNEIDGSGNGGLVSDGLDPSAFMYQASPGYKGKGKGKANTELTGRNPEDFQE